MLFKSKKTISQAFKIIRLFPARVDSNLLPCLYGFEARYFQIRDDMMVPVSTFLFDKGYSGIGQGMPSGRQVRTLIWLDKTLDVIVISPMQTGVVDEDGFYSALVANNNQPPAKERSSWKKETIC